MFLEGYDPIPEHDPVYESAEPEPTPEVQLWRAVVRRALMDGDVEFFASPWGQRVCDMSGLDVDIMLSGFAALTGLMAKR